MNDRFYIMTFDWLQFWVSIESECWNFIYMILDVLLNVIYILKCKTKQLRKLYKYKVF